MVAAGLTGVYAESIPNFELLTLVVFCSGVLLGALDGAMVGVLTMLTFTVLNPYGPAPPLVMLAQVLGQALSGVAGAWYARIGLTERSAATRGITLALMALFLTAIYDVLTNLATGLVLGQIRYWLLAGIPFSLWHIGYNVLLFVAIGTPLVAVCKRYAARLAY
jgi:hypothetical protein